MYAQYRTVKAADALLLPDAVDEVEFDNGFVQGDDSALTAAIAQRQSECEPLLRSNPAQALRDR